ncbi:MAG: cupin domain-containing protein [Desulfitobacteriaceae bacterium]
MIRKAEDMSQEVITSMRGGKGDVQIIHILEKDKGEFCDKGRLYAKNVLKPGTFIGFHEHVGDFEAYFILNGEGTVDDNGTKSVVKPGDLVLTRNGESHSIENTGNTNLEFMALILFD